MFERFEQKPPSSEMLEQEKRLHQEMRDFYHGASCAMRNALMDLEAEAERMSFGEKDKDGIKLCQTKQDAIKAGLKFINERSGALGV